MKFENYRVNNRFLEAFLSLPSILVLLGGQYANTAPHSQNTRASGHPTLFLQRTTSQDAYEKNT